jgi:hypothetical protein
MEHRFKTNPPIGVAWRPRKRIIGKMSYREKLAKSGPRKLLLCDGGGIRGIISIEILARIEAELRKSSGNPTLVLADYFDYVAGTSTEQLSQR